MAKNLVIVESPAKSKTISAFLGADYEVMSSYGHIRDLKKKDLGIDIEKHFEPEYEISEDKQKVVAALKKAVKKADVVWLASDEDREGEAIAWHLYRVLDLDKKNTKRIVFHEITKDAILTALKNPRNIDYNLVDAQQARRVLDRLVGFELSPVLWYKIRPSLSAGRVQSVAVRILVEREREIANFKAESAFRFLAYLKTKNNVEVRAEMDERPKDAETSNKILLALKEADFKIKEIEKKPSKRTPPAPFTTSTLQQEASRHLGYSVSQTMRLAQSLYENGHITYMRTDSVNLSKYAINSAADQILKHYGKAYHKLRTFVTKAKGAQEAHEAIRPTHFDQTIIKGSDSEKKLYDLIWKRTIASQMKDAEIEKTSVKLDSGTPYSFHLNGEQVKFDGFLKVYLEKTDDEDLEPDHEGLLPEFSIEETLNVKSIQATERFSQRPPRYTEASLVKKLEELGIGRPSTYAPTIQTIMKRDYVEKNTNPGLTRSYQVLTLKSGSIKKEEKEENYGIDKNKLVPTDIGIIVNDFLVEYFPKILSYDFTANVEEQFDVIAEGKQEWTKCIANFYDVFHPNVEEVKNMKTERKVGERLLGEDPKSGLPIFAKIGRYGPMLQKGEAGQDSEEKPIFASIPSNMSIETITLNDALDLFKLPRELGEWNGEKLQSNLGKYGPYIRWKNVFVSIPKDYDVYTINYDNAVELLKSKLEEAKKREIACFTLDGNNLFVLNGRYGPYISYKQNNYKIPKATDPEKLDLNACQKIIAEQADKKKTSKKTTKSGRTAKATKTKTATKGKSSTKTKSTTKK